MENAPLDNYFLSLELKAGSSDFAKCYLWPRTPINSIQSKIIKRVGVSDYSLDVPHSRPAMIVRCLKALLEKKCIEPNFTLLDIACGDGVILWQIRKQFPESLLFGVDCNRGKFDTHAMLETAGIKLYSAYIQDLFVQDIGVALDIALMLNTYRGWEHADLKEHEQDLPSIADAWFDRNARYTILTATWPQIRNFLKRGLNVEVLGKGEDNSNMICVSHEAIPNLTPLNKKIPLSINKILYSKR